MNNKFISVDQYATLAETNFELKNIELYVREVEKLIKYCANKQLADAMALHDLDVLGCEVLQTIYYTTTKTDKVLTDLEKHVQPVHALTGKEFDDLMKELYNIIEESEVK